MRHNYSIFALLLIAIVVSGSAKSDPIATIPKGVLRVTIPAGNAASPNQASFSIPLRTQVPNNFAGHAGGVITAVSSNTISDSAAGWGVGTLSQASAPYFFSITTGAARGRNFQISTSVANTQTSVTLLNLGTNLATLGILPGDQYAIYPGSTLLSFFGAGTADGINTVLGGTPSSADVIRIHDGATWNEYHYNLATAQWRKGSVPVNMNNISIRPDAGIIYMRRGTTNLTYLLFGTTPWTEQRLVYNSLGGTFLSLGFPTDTVLGDIAANEMPGWVVKTAANAISNADKIQVFDGVAWNAYHYDSTISQWRTGSLPANMNSVALPAGRPVMVEKVSGVPGFAVWVRKMPYNLQ